MKNYKQCDIILIGFLGHFLVPVARFFSRKPVIFDSFVSIYMTMCMDRKTFKPNGILADLSKWIDKTACNDADLIICDTFEHIKFFSETFHIDPKKIVRLWVGSDNDIIRPGSSIAEQPDLIHFHGEFQQLHGVETIIYAARELPQYRFRLIGDGRQRKPCETLVKELNLNNVTFVNPVPYRELALQMGEAAICLGIFGNTIKARTVIPNKVYEAMAAGKPVITADTPAARELLNHRGNAYLCKIADPESLADAIKTLMSDPELRQSIAERGHQTFLQNCSIDVLGKQLRMECERILGMEKKDMDRKLKFSIITVCRNAENDIEKTIQSVLKQTYPDIEYIIIDGKSTDRTLDVVGRYRDRMAQIISEPDTGIYDAMNKGISAASGDILYFLNAGDTLTGPTVIAQIADAFEKKFVDIVYGKCHYTDIPENRRNRYTKARFHANSIWEIARNSPPQQCFFYRQHCFKNIGTFNTSYSIAGDLDWILRALKNKLTPCFTDIEIANYSLTGKSHQGGGHKYMERFSAFASNLNAGELVWYILTAANRTCARMLSER
ncbi:MAG: glycosyltransferase [Candidatus Omnitrophota bacterium]